MDSKSAHTCTKVYGMNEHSEETKAMLIKHTFALDILTEKPTEAQEFSISSLNISGLKLIPKKKTRKNTGNILNEKNLWS